MQHASKITRMFQSIGQQPTVTFSHKLRGLELTTVAELQYFSKEEGVWVLKLPKMEGIQRQLSYSIVGKTVALYRCFVE